MPLNASPDDNDDKLRLFYVAITRAKAELFLSSHKYKSAESSKKELVPLYFLDKLEVDYRQTGSTETSHISSEKSTLDTWYKASTKPHKHSSLETSFLESQLKDYKLSVTHLLNFLDVVNGGPLKFFEDNLLRFPKSKNPQSGYGSAMHYSLNLFLQEYLSGNQLPSSDKLKQIFKTSLYQQRLSDKDYAEYLQKGLENLEFYYQNCKNSFHRNIKLEYDFSNEGVNLGESKITGKIDKLEFLESNLISVTDYKTGKPLYSVRQTADPAKIKLWKYETQLLFYKLLIENSISFGRGYKVEQGKLEFLDSKSHETSSVNAGLVTYCKLLKEQESETLENLVQIVYNKIIKLDFPEVSHYEKNIKGIQKFSEDLLNNHV
jgi:ATP-dependent exoDNAse (exonuclease V) beta subunit